MSFQLRITRTQRALANPQTVAGKSPYDLFGRLQTILQRHLPPTTASVFAEPSPSSDGEWIEWLSPLRGQPTPLAALPADERAAAETILKRHRDAVLALADRLDHSKATDDAALLRLAAAPRSSEHVFAVGGLPVVILWGEPTPSAPPLSPPSAPPSRRGLWGIAALLLTLLLFALLLFVLFGMRSCSFWPAGPDGEAAKTLPAAPPSDEEENLRNKIRAAEEALRQALEQCRIPSPASPPLGENGAEQPPPTKSAVSEKQEQLPPPKPAVPEKQEQLPPPKPAVPKKQEQLPPRKKYEAPEIALVLDASGSMRLPADMTDREIKALSARAASGCMPCQTELSTLSQRETRLDAAKKAVQSMIKKIPDDVDLGLLIFGSCKGADNFKFFSAKDRSKFLSTLKSIKPMEGTPLARGVERAGNMLDGVSVPGIIVVVTDGEDTCGGDPCAIARALKEKKPNIKINLVSIDGSKTGACMATLTGGKVISPKPGQDWSQIFLSASE